MCFTMFGDLMLIRGGLKKPCFSNPVASMLFDLCTQGKNQSKVPEEFAYMQF